MTWAFFVVVYFMLLSSSTKEYLSLFAQEPEQRAPSPGLLCKPGFSPAVCCRGDVTKCYVTRHCPGSCFVGQCCKPRFHQGRKHMTNLKHTVIPAVSNTLSGVNLPGINFVLSAVFEGICKRADDAQTLPINEQVHWRSAKRSRFVLSDTKRLQKMSLIFKIWPLLKLSELSGACRTKMPSFM